MSNKVLLAREIILLMLKAVVIGIIFVLVFSFVFGLYRIGDDTMAPAVKDGDLAIFYRLDHTYAAGDTLLLTYQGKTQMRRVIAVAGDQVDIVEEGLLINGALQQETEIYQDTQRYEQELDFPLTVSPGHIFVMGDARETAVDSRIYGTVEVQDTLGKVIAVFRRRRI